MTTIHVRIDKETKKKLKQYCLDHEISMSELIVKLIKKEIKK